MTVTDASLVDGVPGRAPGARLDAATAGDLVRRALVAGGESVAEVRPLSEEVREGGPVHGIEARILVDEVVQSRLLYVDTAGDAPAIWVHPDDPDLTSLPIAAFPDALALTLDRLAGLPRPSEIDVLVYRPRRRAVIRARCDGRRPVFVKVVRPYRAQRLVRLHRTLAAAGVPVATLLGWSPAGVVLLDHAEGEPLDLRLPSVHPADVCDAVDRLRSAIAAASGDLAPARPSAASRAGWFAGALADRMPTLRRRLEPLAALAESCPPPEAAVPVHGDLHAAQLFVPSTGPVRITGVIDVDTAALDDPAEDAAAFVSHSLASAELISRSASAADVRLAQAHRALADEAWQRWRADGGSALRTRLTGRLLAQAMQLATSNGHPDGAVRLVAAAEAVAADENALIGSSRSPHR